MQLDRRLASDPRIEAVGLDWIKPNPTNPRNHSKKQIRQIADSIRTFGYTSPVITDENGHLIAGHGRLEATKSLGCKTITAIIVSGLSEAKKRALALADNKIPLNAGWDLELLAKELACVQEALISEGLDTSITGFEPAEIDSLQNDFEDDSSDPCDDVDPPGTGPAVTGPNDLWLLNKHRLLCGDARHSASLDRLMDGERAQAAFLDPPYNVAIRSIVGRGHTKHDEFAMASGEMSNEAFITFLIETLGVAARASVQGAVHYVCMDWRHIAELINVGRKVYGEMLNLVTWVKTNAGQGSFYRSQHELIGVFRVGCLPHLNTIELGRHGRSRSNVWRYAGVNSFRSGRMDDLRAHPTVKPVAMIADAIKDCSRRGQIVLDTFSGSGSTMLAAERVGRGARGMEIDPRYVDVAIRRWQAFTGRDAVHVETGLTFDETAAQQAEQSPPPCTPSSAGVTP